MAESRVSSEGSVFDSVSIHFDNERRNSTKYLRQINNGEEPQPYQHQEYPKLFYKKGYAGSNDDTLVVNNPSEESKLGGEYFDHPDKAKEAGDKESAKKSGK